MTKQEQTVSIISPCSQSDLPFVWQWLNHYAKETLDERSPKTLSEFLAKEKRDIENGSKSYSVLIDGQMRGAVWFENIGDDVGIGHLVFDPANRVATKDKMRAVRQAIAETFAAGFRKIIWQFFADNRAFHVFLKRLGAEHEGIFRKQARRGDEWVDAVFMASFPEDK